ncbi:hypothetical protein LRD69_20980 [Streptomyces sp. JH14]|uniref:hypothetical protein n=1 Tax=Streptomyces sp. JH14 TaxID=2793630 RepID=UPI0023F6BD3E|nr:hypothetical protein [Streptomyces sp. JH14]MDF6044571.1 hypothetical protein [Streptomyces sp. JH14]
MSGWRTAEAVLRDHRVRDVLVPGWIDRDDDLPEFRPQPLVVWLRLDGGQGLLRFASQGQYARLGVSLVPGVDWADVELLAEAEDEVIVASCGEQLFGDGRDELRCTRLRAYRTSAGTDCTCLALDFEGGRTLFLDPTWPFGIKVGNEADEQRWLKRYGSGGADGGATGSGVGVDSAVL